MQYATTLSQNPHKKFSVMWGLVVVEQPHGFTFRNADIYVAEYNASDIGDNDIHIYLPEQGECHVEVLSLHFLLPGRSYAVFFSFSKRSATRA
jgi:hypothetical protein